MSNKVREERRRQDMTQEQLAKKSGISRMAIYQIEHSITKYPTMPTAIKLAAALGTNVELLFNTKTLNSSEQEAAR